MEKIDFKEFLLGMAIITFCIGFWSLVEPLPSHTTIEVKINRIEEISCTTDEEGNVKVYER